MSDQKGKTPTLVDPYFLSEDANFHEWISDLPTGQSNTMMTSTDSKVCECGVWKVYGKDIDPSFHTDYCPLYQQKS